MVTYVHDVNVSQFFISTTPSLFPPFSGSVLELVVDFTIELLDKVLRRDMKGMRWAFTME